ncbi:UDP-glycosyltransferase 76B1 [Vitis vinifera]|uniref:UDP-glycosyltransferase 76B1 n=1 Tax=Vitis vinifera TaxID=29760 RepID=A0A438E0U3_VITVI|nr:UDP-glycosyltransferase 76B1 [Vitis vinifera]
MKKKRTRPFMEKSTEIELQQRKRRRQVPFQGHINPTVQLANIIDDRGFSVTIIHTHFNSPNPSDYPHLTFHLIPDGLLKSHASSTDVIIALIQLLNINCVTPFQDCLSRLLLEVYEEPIIAKL